MSKELTISEKYILMEMIFAEVFYFLQLAVFLYLIRRWYRGDEAVRVKLKVPEKRDTLLRHDWVSILTNYYLDNTPTVKLSDLSIGSELSVRRRKREGLAKRPPGETSDQHNLHNAPSSLGIHNEEWL
ncbi:hypothetical protein EGR_09638 [Echinococcus granulosus]|uniref:Uncharacterized protein n=1 Tax=Echinococcus granulosus TaxID=6210 RepID=W6UAL5_ECHGR|nr:hypothetical protein EGR_09638 [Echinococcus granulosus]EUB55497.1 hypothetical protein EGR_09638 [Echinococcus granulosus]